MRSVQEHLAACLAAVGPLPPLDVVLPDAVGCILAEDVVAGGDLPVADLAGLDGYAVRAADVVEARPDRPVTLHVTDELRAGQVDQLRLVGSAAVRIASGAPMPIEADAVVPVEQTDFGTAEVAVRTAVLSGENVRRRAEDLRAGEVVLPAGERVGARQVALLAAVGRGRVAVHPRPRVVIVSVGDELVEPGRPAQPGQVFDANGHALATAVQDAGAATFRVAAVPDERRALRETLEDQLVRADLVITTGGLSYGANDTVKEVLAPLGTVRFDNVAMWPGRQLGVGHIGEGTPIFCLPGDPVSVQVAFEAFVRPALRTMAGYAELYRPSVAAEVTGGWYSPYGRREFVRAHVTGTPAEGYRAEPVGAPASLLLSALARSNAFAVVPEDVTDVRAGDRLHCLLLDS
ncbi:molybdotransferase-like divisome protein Glp [Georgenia thermotolerans]|uniref:Molybdopterin molybdenumtransferase n=1 Tax=Georgenia thermotolerans TaxID=527326 RepID=A0A7J5UNE2_9MICO|nr:gephyrin-like molybdotransferase Glp [Georgenia thermotolerans]KAE8763423.1 molybdopterin molybdenumtransferase MoeA [Georgenia thermotolerans]